MSKKWCHKMHSHTNTQSKQKKKKRSIQFTLYSPLRMFKRASGEVMDIDSNQTIKSSFI